MHAGQCHAVDGTIDILRQHARDHAQVSHVLRHVVLRIQAVLLSVQHAAKRRARVGGQGVRRLHVAAGRAVHAGGDAPTSDVHLAPQLQLLHHGAQLGAALAHRQLETQRINLPQEQVRRHPAPQSADVHRHLGRNIWVAVAIAAHPASEGYRRGVQRQRAPRVILKCVGEAAQVGGHGVPQRLLDDVQPAARLVQHGGLGAPQLVGGPKRSHLAHQVLKVERALLSRQVRPIIALQARLNLRVLVLQRAPVDLRRVGRQDNLHVLLADVRVQLGLRHPLCNHLCEDVLERAALSLALAARAHAVVRLRDAAEVEVVRAVPDERNGLVQGQVLDLLSHPLEEEVCLLGAAVVAQAAAGHGERVEPLQLVRERGADVPVQAVLQQALQQGAVVVQRLQRLGRQQVIGRHHVRHDGG
mmetsp:Transcript_18332/g.56845  ORF Transcript_18332/g.56845 Transcript_18332/m.56845 type:complete len:415 (-) Transcript_18332:61-1305(-)